MLQKHTTSIQINLNMKIQPESLLESLGLQYQRLPLCHNTHFITFLNSTLKLSNKF